MLIVRYAVDGAAQTAGVVDDEGVLHDLGVPSLAALLRLDGDELRDVVLAGAGGPAVAADHRLLAPVDGLTEVWASGVTYLRSREARMDESQVADVYALVYDARRPELFLKSVAWRVRADGDTIGVREDSEVNVPEAELALVLNRSGDVVGYTACNDVSSRSIEGENPLYLPQAKIYAGACALGPGIRPAWELDPGDLGIELRVERDGVPVLTGATRTSSMHRTFEELAAFLFAADVFPDGAVLSTGTGIVPDLDFTLHPGDVVRVSVEGIGALTNVVVAGLAASATPPGQGTTARPA